MKKELDFKMAQEIKGQNAQLYINEDTKYNITYDVISKDGEKFLYIKMDEITCDAPFYYNRSYTINELHNLNSIFKAFEKEDFEALIPFIKDLFDNGKISIKFADKAEEIIIMELKVILFSKSFKLNFELYREMILYQKDQKLIDLYTSTKNKIKILKEMKLFIEKIEADEKDKELIDDIIKLYSTYEIPGIENDNIKQVRHNPEKPKTSLKKSYISSNLCNLYKVSGTKGFSIDLNLLNNSKVDWPVNKIQLVYDKEKSNLNYSEIVYPIFDVTKGQDGDFTIKFDKKNLEGGNKYLCNLQIYVDNVKLENSDIPLNIELKSKKK
jgi:hypothetical protein